MNDHSSTRLTISPWMLLILIALLIPAKSQAEAVTDVPLDKKGKWEILEYASIPANTVTFSQRGLGIGVNKSASPLVYPIEAQRVDRIDFEIAIEGDLALADFMQGEEGADDFLFRLGIVYEGDQRLGFLQRAVAADWIKTLYALAPENTGIDKIHFYNVYSDRRLAGKDREHPLSGSIKEYFKFYQPEKGHLRASINPDPNKRVLALWLSSDGDDTQSEYRVVLKRLTLHH